MLSPSQALPYLLDRNLLTPAHVVDHGIVVNDLSRRNRNFTVQTEDGPSYLLKQAVDQDPSKKEHHTVRYEAEIYRLFATLPAGQAVLPFLPHVYGYDPKNKIFLLEFLPDALSLREIYFERARFPERHGILVARALSALHQIHLDDLKTDDFQLAPSPVPSILGSHTPTLAMLHLYSVNCIQLIRIMQQFPNYGRFLDDLAADWRSDRLIHSDIKWENWCLCRPPDGKRRSRLKLLDWETAGIGDIGWDIGSVFGDYIGFWILTQPSTPDLPEVERQQLGRYPLERMKPAMVAFWRSYTEAMGWQFAERQEHLLRAVRFLAVRLLQTAFEQLQATPLLTGAAIILLQTSYNILERPEDAIRDLLGIEEI